MTFPRFESPLQGFIAVGLAAFSCSALAAYVGDARPQTFGDVLIGTISIAMLVVISVALLSVRIGRERLRAALTAGTEVAFLGVVCGAVAAATGVFTDGAASTALVTSDAFRFVLTGGLLPATIGPSAVVRFFPLAAAVSVFVRFRRKGTTLRALAAAAFAFVLPMLALLSTTIAGVVISTVSHASVSDASALFKTLVSSHADGYWTSIQSERFLLAPTRQAENAFLGFRGAIALLLGGAAFVFSALGSSAAGALIKRMTSVSAIRLLLIAATGLALGFATSTRSTSYVTMIATLLGVMVMIAWVASHRFFMDLVELPRHEREHPEYPLPSGIIQSQDLETLAVALLVFALVGAMVLGYPVFLALLAATLASRFFASTSVTVHSGVRVVTGAMMALALAEAGGLLTIRTLSVPGWVGRVFLGVACIVVLETLFRRYALEMESRAVAVILSVLGCIAAAVVANQGVFWILVVLAAIALSISARTPGKWHRLAPWVFDGAIAIVALLSLFVPQIYRRF